MPMPMHRFGDKAANVPLGQRTVGNKPAEVSAAAGREATNPEEKENQNPRQALPDRVPPASGQCSRMPAPVLQRAALNVQQAAGSCRGAIRSELGSRDRTSVRDIDEEDKGRFQYSTEYVGNVFQRLFEVEQSTTVPEGFLTGHRVTPKYRAVLVNRMIEVADRFKMSAEVTFLTVNYIDRYLSASPEVGRDSLHAVGVTALWLASKVEEIRVIAVSDLEFITDQEATVQQIIQTEAKMLTRLKFEVMPAHALLFLRRFSKAASITPARHSMAKYILETSFTECACASMLPSLLAAAALYLVLRIDHGKGCWDATMQYYSRYSEADLTTTANILRGVTKKVTQTAAVFVKYRQPKYNRIALHSDLAQWKLDAIVL